MADEVERFTQSRMMETIMRCLPYPQHIKELDLTHDRRVQFRWRGTRVVISLHDYDGGFSVEEGSDPPGLLSGSNFAIVLEQLLKVTVYGDNNIAHALSASSSP